MPLPSKLLEAIGKAKGITQDSRKVEEGFIFFAIRGERFDGHEFVGEVLRRGALAAVVEKRIGGERVIRVEDTRRALGESSHLFYGRPSESLRLIGVTGTNGKTTTTHILERILTEAGLKVGLLGTIHYRLGEKILGEGRTTPDAVTWQRTLRDMVSVGATHAVAEISSHALDQHRIWGTRFEAVIFTNLTQDHLDYHGDMESYYRSKRKLFTDYSYGLAVINCDDSYGKRLIEELGGDVVTYGREGDLRILNFRTGFRGSQIEIEFGGKRYSFKTNLVGEFQAYNVASALAYALSVGIDPEIVRKALLDIHVPGRFEVYRSKRGFLVIVDYAHTPDAFRNVLKTIRRLAKGRVITVFGAGGNRDRGKRPLMGKEAERWSDLVVLTSDNPRDEDPDLIIEDIMRGIGNREKVLVEKDRGRAIRMALEIAKSGDIVALLGKGHESFQEIRGVKYPFSDAMVVKEVLEGGRDVLRF